MEDQIELIVEEPEQWRGGVSWPVIVSVIAHTFLIAWLIHSYRPVQKSDAAPPIAHYVELIRQNPQDFTEAPGAKVKSAPLNAPLSGANRKASTPQPTGDTPTTRPGDGSHALYKPRTEAGDGTAATRGRRTAVLSFAGGSGSVQSSNSRSRRRGASLRTFGRSA